MVNNALFAGSKCEKVSKKNTNRREEKGEGERVEWSEMRAGVRKYQPRRHRIYR